MRACSTGFPSEGAPAGRVCYRGRVAKQESIEVEGLVTQALPNAVFRVELANGHEVLAHVSGRVRRYRIKVLLGDRVLVELSPYDLSKGRITYRFK